MATVDSIRHFCFFKIISGEGLMSFILVAIDGTSSATKYNTVYKKDKAAVVNQSFVKQFYQSAKVSQKQFWEGPANAATGSDSGGILEQSWSFLTKALRDKPESKVVLVGHSRGGHMVTSLAIRLQKHKVGDFVVRMTNPGWKNTNPPQLVHFLGLYDAVDRTISHGGDTKVVPSNVVNFAHAIRSSTVGSRTSFGNTATHVNKSNVHLQNYSAQPFDATHGAIGGAVPHSCPSTLDFAANLNVASLVAGKMIKPMLDDFCHTGLTEEQNTKKGNDAHQYLLREARRAEVPV